MSLALLLLTLPSPETVLVVDGFVVGSRVGAGWKAAGPEFAKTHRALDFYAFGIGSVKRGKPRREGLTAAEEDNGTYLDKAEFDGVPRLAGLVPKALRPMVRLAAGATYERATRSYLARRSVRVPKARITGVWRGDLDGDGTAEVLIEAGYPAQSPDGFKWPKGSYALVLLRSLKEGRVVETPLEFAVPDGQGIMETKRLRGVADLDGDGRMEILTTGRGYEWNNAALWSYRKGVASRLLENGVGH